MRIGRLKSNIANLTFCVCMGVSGLITIPAPPVYAQTPTRTMNGIEVSGRFLDVWSKQGNEQSSLYVNGLPSTPRRSEISLEDGRAYDTQWFERARYEMHPENKQPNDVLLGRLGASRVEGRGKIDVAIGKVADPSDTAFVGIDKPSDLSASKLWFPETRHTLSGKLLDAWKRYGGLQQFGFPLSEPLQETSQADGKPYTVQYFERNRMELHPEKPAPYDVELGLLGVEQYGARAVPADELPVAPPKDVKSSKDEITIRFPSGPGAILIGDRSKPALAIRSLIDDHMVGRDDNENLFPVNAWYVPTIENGGAYFVGTGSDRYLAVKYKLRRGIKWSDGVDLTSQDAVFAYALLLRPDIGAFNRTEYLRLQSVDNPDRYTVIYKYRSLWQAEAFLSSVPDREHYSYLQTFVDQKKPVVSRDYSELGYIYPEHVLEGMTALEIGISPYAIAPIGSGPYKVQKWRVGYEMVLVQNEYYNLTSKPAIKEITLTYITNPKPIASQIQAGDIDIYSNDAFTLPPGNVAELGTKGIRVAIRPGVWWEHLDFYIGYGPFKDRNVRESIIRAINRQRIADMVYDGAGKVMNSPVSSNVYYSLGNPTLAKNYPEIAANHRLPIYPYDPEHARKLLDSAGWVVGSDGIRAKGDQRLSFYYGLYLNSVREQIRLQIVSDLRAAGIEALKGRTLVDGRDRVFLEDGTFALRQTLSTSTRSSDFGEWVCEVVPDYTLDGGRLQAMLRSVAYKYCDPTLKEANDKFKTEIDLRTQVEAAAQAQLILMENVAVIPLFQYPNIELVTDKLANYKLPNSTTSSFWNARQWYFR